ncbi:hypothetical protein X947_2386 [Burkholderia pseudomallei MSHR7334]|nr:hypothetical protein X947_2386 [Burkholderia pseudomallei MSHR7334]
MPAAYVKNLSALISIILTISKQFDSKTQTR